MTDAMTDATRGTIAGAMAGAMAGTMAGAVGGRGWRARDALRIGAIKHDLGADATQTARKGLPTPSRRPGNLRSNRVRRARKTAR
jgi:hypothetical protein